MAEVEGGGGFVIAMVVKLKVPPPTERVPTVPATGVLGKVAPDAVRAVFNQAGYGAQFIPNGNRG